LHADANRECPGWRAVTAERRRVSGVAIALWITVAAIALAALIFTIPLQMARNLGHAMEPTFEDQEFLIANKLAYRVGDVQAGDIVVTSLPFDRAKTIVKRVIGKPGDTVQIADGVVSVNGVPLKDDYVPREFRSHDDWGPSVIPADSFFVLGDHRNNSSDSRHWGVVRTTDIRSKIIARFGGSRGWARM
jgi:signal peptidase I